MEMNDLPSTNNNGTSNGSIDHKINGEVSLKNRRPRVAILGTGNYGRALAGQFYQAGVDACVGSRYPVSKTFQGLSLTSYEEAINQCSIVVLCIPPHAYEDFLPSFKTALMGKTVVEISNLDKKNASSNALRVQESLSSSYVVKAFNTVSAYSLENDAYGASRDTYVCGDHEHSKTDVMQMLREIGLNPIDRGSLRSAVMIEKLPFRFFTGWGTALIITFATLAPILFYTYLRFFWYESEEDQKFWGVGLRKTSITIAWLMHTLLALTFLPGTLAGFIQIFAGTKYMRFPNWFDNWMKSRKQLGLICLFLASIHGCLSCLAVGSGESKYTLVTNFLKPGVFLFQGMDNFTQASMILATFALAFMAILGITSLPSVNARMSWMEWDFVQRGLGFFTLILGTIHVLFLMYDFWDKQTEHGWAKWEKHPDGIFPNGAFIMPMFPLFVIFLKFVLMLPGLSCYLYKIRKGKVGNNKLMKV